MLKNVRTAVKGFVLSPFGRVTTIVAAVATAVTLPAVAGATGGDVISDAFTTLQGTLVGYLGDAVVVIIALLSLGMGIRFLVKWIKKAVSSS